MELGLGDLYEYVPPRWRPVVALGIFALAGLAYYIALQNLKPKKKRG
jgi:hypothetical protein